jgi:hypothetical protein
MSHRSALSNRPFQTLTFALCLVAALLTVSVAEARSKESPRVDVTAAYIELRSGPGRGYPVFHTIERGNEMSLIKRRTDWYRVKTDRGVEGWVNRHELESGTGDPVLHSLRDTAMDDYLERRVEFGFAAGDFDGDSSFTFRAGYGLSEHFLAEVALTQVSGTFSSTTLYHGNLLVMPITSTRVSPFFTIGLGRFHNDPKAVLVDAEDTREWAANAGVGVRGYLTRRFLLRGDYRHYVAMVSDDNNEDFGEWSLGFSVFF